MNKEKVAYDIRRKYGVSPETLQNSSLAKINELRVYNGVEKRLNDKLKFLKKPIATIIKGGSIGAGAAGAINTAFPNIVPVIGAALTEANVTNAFGKTLSLAALASKPVDMISGPTILGIGAATGAVLYSGYVLVKTAVRGVSIVNDRRNAKRLLKKQEAK